MESLVDARTPGPGPDDREHAKAQARRIDHLYDAVLFDLDGVLTSTSALHAACWKQTFEDVIGESFDIERDYLAHVDGKPRDEGVRDFLRSRAVVVEDSLVGVAAGHAGEFGLVIGVARGATASDLYSAGADVVIEDLRELIA